MKNFIKQFTISVIILSIVYVCYVSYININGIIIGTKVIENKNKQFQIIEMSETSYGKFVGLETGDIILRINKEKPSAKFLKGDNLNHIKSLDVSRNGKQIHLDDFDIVNLDKSYSFFVFVLPLVFYFLSIVCIFYILKVNQTRKSFAGYILILFLLDISIAYISAGGPFRGHVFNRYVNLFTFIASPIFYLQFIQQYFEELGKKFASRLINILYIFPIFNVIIEFFRKKLPSDIIINLNLISFFLVTLSGFVLVFYHLYKYKYSEHAYILKVLILTNTLSFAPFLLFYVVPNILTGAYIFPALASASLLVLIPFGLVYQFVANKIFDIEFILGRMRYYTLLAVIPTLVIVGVLSVWAGTDELQMNPIRQTVFIFIIMFAVFYFKEIIDFKFRLKRFSEKYNYQDSIFKYTQFIRSITSLKQMFKELKKTILDVLLVSKAYVFEVTSEGAILYHDKKDNEPDWEMYSKEFKKVTSEIGKIIELNRGFLIKIGERGGSSYVLLCLSTINTPRLTRDEISWLKTLSFYTSVSMENVIQIEELMNHLQDLKQQGSNPVWLKKLMFAIEEKQRSDLARDLHDSVLQDLISLKRQCELFVGEFKKDDNPCREEVQDKLVQMNEQMSDVISMTRETCHELRPQLLYDLGLVKALSKLVAQQQERVPFHIRLNTGRFSATLDLDSQLNLYRIIQEFLSNAVKHSKATDVLIMLISIQNKIVLHYEDDGVGFDQDKNSEHSMSMGLSGIKERVRALDGRLRIETSEGKGFKADIEIEL
ncbi:MULTISPECIES: sensor histidine kinase [Bacillus]|uniref:sensor histidine kinase n=1 Tax=Bacillus sp. SKDU12 TaxID=1337053 RepID=UPI001389B212|nr:histidine kinase [Bacillus sp. SKDU12]